MAKEIIMAMESNAAYYGEKYIDVDTILKTLGHPEISQKLEYSETGNHTTQKTSFVLGIEKGYKEAFKITPLNFWLSNMKPKNVIYWTLHDLYGYLTTFPNYGDWQKEVL